MNAPLEPQKLVKQWVEKAESDYQVFQLLLKRDESFPYDAISYHAQQCAEKYFKARLVYLSINFPKTHDIGEIVKLFPPGSNIPLSIAEQEKLTDYAWMGRYPGDQETVTRLQAEEAASLATKVRTAIRASFPKDVLK
jgi:HEPN domain-containing protein